MEVKTQRIDFVVLAEESETGLVWRQKTRLDECNALRRKLLEVTRSLRKFPGISESFQKKAFVAYGLRNVFGDHFLRYVCEGRVGRKAAFRPFVRPLDGRRANGTLPAVDGARLVLDVGFLWTEGLTGVSGDLHL